MKNTTTRAFAILAVTFLSAAVFGENKTATFGSAIGDPNPHVGGIAATNIYNEAITPLTYSPGGGYFDATEFVFQSGGAEPAPDDTGLVFYLGGVPVSAPLNMALGQEEAHFTFQNLTPNHPFTVTVTIGDMDDYNLTWDPAGLDPAVETLAVFSGNSMIGTVDAVVGAGLSQWVTTTLAVKAMSDGNGNLDLGFNFPFLWVPGDPAPPFGGTNGARVEQIAISSAVTMRADSAPNTYGSPDWAPWWLTAKADVANGSFLNMRSGTYPDTLLCDPYDEIVYSTGDLGRRLHWIYRVDGETVATLTGRFEVKWVIDWGGTHYTYEGGGWAIDGPEVGWTQPSSWEDDAGAVTGSLGFAWWSIDNDALPFDTDGNPYNEVDQADIDANREVALTAQTYARGMIRYMPTAKSPWEITSIELDIVGSIPGDVNGDGTVNTHDLLALIGQWGPCIGCSADFNGDDVVDVTDLLTLINNWGVLPPAPRSRTPRLPMMKTWN